MQLYNPLGYQLACDKCGKELNHGGRKVFASAYAAVEAAKTLGWKSSKSSPYKDLCPKCRAEK